MKFKQGLVYFKKEIKQNVKGNDFFNLVTEQGKPFNNVLFNYMEDDDEFYLDNIYSSEWIDPIYNHSGTCKGYTFIVPNEVFEKAKERRQQRLAKKH